MITIKNGQLLMYDISNEYKDYLRKFDSRVSLKESRKFYGILVTSNDIDYYIPFTSKVNKKTNSKLTLTVKDSKNNVIAKLLINNMIPVNEKDSLVVDIEKEKFKTYFNSEIQYLRKKKVKNELIKKVENVFNILNDDKHKDYIFFRKLCCDFNLLETKCKEWNLKKGK